MHAYTGNATYTPIPGDSFLVHGCLLARPVDIDCFTHLSRTSMAQEIRFNHFGIPYVVRHNVFLLAHRS
jgi:hypothetical protein